MTKKSCQADVAAPRYGARNAVELLRTVAEKHPDVEAFVEPERTLTFSEWDERADGVARLFADRGVRRSDVVLLCLPSSTEYAVCYQAAMRLGAVTSGINPRLGSNEVSAIVTATDPTVAVIGDMRPPPSLGPQCAVVQRAELGAEGDPAPINHHIHADDPVAIVWTSGTTGTPKGAVFDHRNLETVAYGAGDLGAYRDRRYAPNPFSHIVYMTRMWEDIAKVITTVIPPTPWKAADMLALIETERVTVGQGVPTQWRLVLDHPLFDSTDLSSLRIAGTGGSQVSHALVKAMQARLPCPVVIGYTSTEAAITAGSRATDSADIVATTVGTPRNGVELQVVDEEGRTLRPGEIGRVRCRSGAVMRGYWRDPTQTAAVLDADGWLTTGDLGWIDDSGYLTLVGRKNDMYIRGGYNIYPAEVESILTAHDSILDAAVVSRTDPVLGEVGVAFICATSIPTPTHEEIRRWCATRLADYKTPDIVVFVSDLPLTAMRKIDKKALKERAQALDPGKTPHA